MSVFLVVCKFLMPFVVGAVSTALLNARQAERKFISERVRNDRLRALLLHLDEVVTMVVKDLAQTMDELFRLAADGKLTPQARQILKAQALARVQAHMGQNLTTELRTLLHLAEEVFVEFIASKVESKVFDMKRQQELFRRSEASSSVQVEALAA